MYAFGAGRLLAAMTLDAAGSDPAALQWVEFGTLQDVQVDIQFESKALYGNRGFPAAVGRGKGKIEVKAKTADITGRILGDLVFGSGATTGQRRMGQTQATEIPDSTYKITPTPPGSGTWVEDLGVVDAATGLPLTRVSSAPTTGEYSVVAGEYTFASDDQGDDVIIRYVYTTASGGLRGSITSDLMGYTPMFRALLENTYEGKTFSLDLLACVSDQFSLPFTNDDFSINDFSFQAMVPSNAALDTNGNPILGYWSVQS